MSQRSLLVSLSPAALMACLEALELTRRTYSTTEPEPGEVEAKAAIEARLARHRMTEVAKAAEGCV